MGKADISICETHIIHPDCRERFLPLEGLTGAALRSRDLSLAGLSELRTEYRIGRSAARYHVVLATLEGTGSLLTPTGSSKLCRGSLLLLPALTPHLYRLTGKRWRILWFHLRASTPRWAAFRDLSWQLGEADNLPAMAAAAESLLLETGMPAAPQTSFAERTRLAGLHAEILATLLERELRPFCGGGPEVEPNHTPEEAALRARLDRIWGEVDGALQLPWNVEQLARLAHMSPGHFHRVTARILGMSPMELVTQLRMTRARALLISTDLPAYSVAALVGYENPFAFSVAFKRKVGQSPRDFRKSTTPTV